MSISEVKERRELLNASGLKGGLILDVGMGSCGCMSFFLARKGFDVVGIDRSPRAIHDSRKDAKRERFKGSFAARRADGEKLPFDDNQFDAVFSYHSMHHIRNVRRAIKEMFRVCRKGGRVLISDFRLGEHGGGHGKVLKSVEASLRRCGKQIRKAKTKHNIMFICRK